MYVIKTPNPNYDGVTIGVKFENGTAVVEGENLRNILVKDYGYLSDEVKKPEEPASIKQAPKPRRTSATKTSGK
ncbi:hypothetical protein D3C77_755840 [compost metagenome]